MADNKEKFRQATIFDQMRYNAQDIVDQAQREYDEAESNLENCSESDFMDKVECRNAKVAANNNLNKVQELYNKKIAEIKEFEK